jgi:hypothetical protein
MKKILTIATTALLSTVAAAAHALPVNFPGTVATSCTLTVLPGALTGNATPPTALTTTTDGTAKVICNDASKTLTLTNVAADNTIPTQPDAPVVAFGFKTGGTGVFASATGTTAALTNPTNSTGDTANIEATVTAVSPKLLKSGSYIVVVGAEITP